tara:strand:+ start:167 stop:439 length:273 start_codon:yes stop_codon:yes gene_type:complete
MKTIKRLLYKLYPFKSRRRYNSVAPKMYHTFVTYDSFSDQMSSVRTDIRELRGLVNQLAAKDKLRALNGVLMTEKEYKQASDAIDRYNGR